MKFKDIPLDATFTFVNPDIEINNETTFQKYNMEPPQAIFIDPLNVDPEIEVDLVED